MASEEVNSMEGDIEKQWVFPKCKPTEKEEKEIIARDSNKNNFRKYLCIKGYV